MGRVPHGASSLYLAGVVSFLNAHEAVFEAMIEGWRMQQIGGRHLKEDSVSRALGVVRRFESYAGKKPWEWSAGDFDEWMALLVSQRKVEAGALTPGLGHVESSSCWRKRDDQDYGQEELLR